MSQLVVPSSRSGVSRAAFEREVAERLGVLPNFFCSAPEAPEVVRELWAFAKSAYLDSPLPALFKERLFVHLSRFCEVRYCIVRHLGFLVGRGHPAGDADAPPQTLEEAINLLRQPVLRGEALEAALERLESIAQPQPVPAPSTPLERDIFAAATLMLTEPARCERATLALRRALGARVHEQLTAYIAFIRTAHFWTLTHPGLEFEDDVGALLRDHEELARLLLEDSEAGRCELGQRLFDELVLLRQEHDDRDALRRATRALEEKDRHKDEFIAMLGHELRNPLATVRTIAQTLPLLPIRDPVLEQLSERLNRQTASMARMIDDLLDASRLGLGKVSITAEPLDLAAIVRDIVQERAPQVRAQQLQLELVEQAPAVELPVRGDRQRLAQIIENLLDNAVKFTPPGGRIRLLLERQDGEARVTVEDSGIGFDEVTRQTMFEPFRQASQDLDRKRGGLGLGLAIAQMLAQLHRGVLGATSAGPDQGARFMLALPVDTGNVTEPAQIERRAGPSERPRVLLVEDNRDLADSLSELMSMLGWEVILAYDAPAGLMLAQEHCPRVILCDLGLPGMDGFAFARELHAAQPGRQARLIAMSGYGRSVDHERAQAAGFERLIVKPVDLDEIRRVLGEDVS